MLNHLLIGFSCCLFTLAFGSAPSFAIAEIADQPISAEYALGMGDTIKVTALNHEDLSGTFVIGPDGAFRYPFAGSIRGDGRTLAEVELELKKKLKQHLSNDVQLFVDIGQFRPIYVIGDVVRPGEVPYAPGIRTITAIAKAGGVPSFAQLSPQLAVAAANAESDLRVAETEFIRLLIQRAGLDAALSDQESITLPNGLETLRFPLVNEFLSRQTAVLQGERERAKRVREMIDQEMREMASHLSSLQKEQAIVSNQSDTVGRQLQTISQAARAGLATNQAVLILQRFQSESDTARQRILSNISQVRQKEIELRSRWYQLDDQLKQERLRLRLATEADIAKAETRVAQARLIVSRQPSGLLARPTASTQERPKFSITRITGHSQYEIDAVASTELLPGDVLHVRVHSAAYPLVSSFELNVPTVDKSQDLNQK